KMPKIIATLIATAIFANRPNNPYVANMNAITMAAPTYDDVLPLAIESWPRPGPTVRSSMMVSGAGNAPALSRMARSLALSTVKLPDICPEPPRMGSRMTGADITWLSRTMANGLPTFSCVTWANLRAPDVLNRKDTIGSLVR